MFSEMNLNMKTTATVLRFGYLPYIHTYICMDVLLMLLFILLHLCIDMYVHIYVYYKIVCQTFFIFAWLIVSLN